MSLPLPNLDNLDFEQLIEDGRAQIPRYAPEWTDHNLHDPGITILELLAWVVDQQIYQIGFISDRHLESFAALLGVRRQPAVPAQGLIWPSENTVVSEADLQRGVHVACLQQPDIPFELHSSVHLTPALYSRDGIHAVTARGTICLSNVNRNSRASFSFHPFTSQSGEQNWQVCNGT